MRPVTFSFPTETAAEVCATQTTTATSQALILNGGLSNIGQLNSPAGGYVPQVVFPGIQRTVQISSTGNISTSTFTFAGFDIRGVAIATSIAGPTGTVIPTKTVSEFNRVTSVSVGTLASVPFTIGGGATGSTNWVHPNSFVSPFSMNISITTGTSQPVMIQDTPDDASAAAPTNIFTNLNFATVVTSTQSAYTTPVNYVRAIFTATLVSAATSSASTAAVVTFLQAGA